MRINKITEPGYYRDKVNDILHVNEKSEGCWYLIENKKQSRKDYWLLDQFVDSDEIVEYKLSKLEELLYI